MSLNVILLQKILNFDDGYFLNDPSDSEEHGNDLLTHRVVIVLISLFKHKHTNKTMNN